MNIPDPDTRINVPRVIDLMNHIMNRNELLKGSTIETYQDYVIALVENRINKKRPRMKN